MSFEAMTVVNCYGHLVPKGGGWLREGPVVGEARQSDRTVTYVRVAFQ
jgi:hypothetical protein